MTMVQTEILSADGSNATGNKASSIKETRQPFPVKVYEMLEDADSQGFATIVSWNHQGTGFMVHRKDLFIKQIVPQYFNQTKYKSFQRQLSLYGFQRIAVGQNKGLRYHEKLRRGRHDLVCQMKPVGYKPRGTTKMLEQQRQDASSSPSAALDQAMKFHSSSPPLAPMTVVGDSSSSSSSGAAAPTVLLPTVISSGSLDKEHTVVQVLSQVQTQLPIQQLTQARIVSPGAISEGEESCNNEDTTYHITDEDLKDILEQGLFEGKSFYLMTPSQEVLKEFLPAPSLSVGAASTASAPLPPPAVMDAELKKAYEIGYKMALAMNKKKAAAANEQQDQAVPNAIPSSPSLRLEDCVDALDFHAANVAAATQAGAAHL